MSVTPPSVQSSKKPSHGDHIANAISLIGEKRKLSEGRISTADIVGKMAGQARESLGNKPRGWRSFAGGVAQGIQNGSALAKMYEGQKDYEESKKLIDSLEATNKAAIEASEVERKEEMANKAVFNDYLAYEKVAKMGGDPQTLKGMMKQIFEKHNSITGNNYNPVDTFANDYKYAIVEDPKTGQRRPTNIEAMIMGEKYRDNVTSSMDPDYQMRRQEERQDKEREFASKDRDYALQERKFKAEYPENGLTGSDREYAKKQAAEQAKVDVKRSGEISERGRSALTENNRLKHTLSILDKAKPGIGFNVRKMLVNVNSALPKYLQVDLKDLGDAAAMIQVRKNLIQSALERVKKVNTRPTNFDLETTIQGLPQESDPEKAIRRVLNDIMIVNEVDIQETKMKDAWESEYGSIRKRNNRGESFDEVFTEYADKNIWPRLVEGSNNGSK